jgi:hypothetical protein
MNETEQSLTAIDTAAHHRRLELTRKAFKEFYAQCFWSYREDAEITDEDIPWVLRELRLNGGHRGYRVAGEICR